MLEDQVELRARNEALILRSDAKLLKEEIVQLKETKRVCMAAIASKGKELANDGVKFKNDLDEMHRSYQGHIKATERSKMKWIAFFTAVAMAAIAQSIHATYFLN